MAASSRKAELIQEWNRQASIAVAWYDHVFPDHLVKRDNALGGELWREGNGIAQSSNDKH
jgi:hypothetical protein